VSGYDTISIGGGDTAAPLNVAARLRLLQSVIALDGARVLDCGCGSGGYVVAMRELGADAHGVEYSADKVAAYHAQAKEPERVRVGDLRHIDEPTASFDLALLNEVLEHVPDERAALAEIHRVLRPGGRLVVFSPNRFYPFETHGVTLRANGSWVRPSRAVLVPYVPIAIGKHLFTYSARNYWPRELQALVRDAGFTIERTSYLWQTFENISGSQPRWMMKAAPVLRRIAGVLQDVPVVRVLGTSQVVVATKT
jgi:SAM-dependent methyltransferase